MIISKTPYRISFFGGGTDFPAWFKEYGGAVLSTTIDKYCYISLRKLPPFFHHKHRIVYSEIELVDETAEIKHPLVRECLKYVRLHDGLEIHHDGDLPSRSGVASSSSFTVGLLNALKAYQGQMISPAKLSETAILIERDIIGDAGGYQDQVAVSHGGFNHITFSDSQYIVSPVIMSPGAKRELENSLCLFYLGKSRSSEVIEKKKIESLSERKDEFKAIGNLVSEGLRTLRSANLDVRQFGKLLHEGWKLKKSLAHEVSNPDIDEIYDRAIKCGAYGGKLLGAGGGGFFLFCIDGYNRDIFTQKMSDFLHVPFRFEYSGSKIAFMSESP